MTSGVYQILNCVNGKIYVGSAINFKSRWQKHKSDLSLQKHDNRRLQNAVNKYGIDSFSFSILATCPKEYVVKLEQYFIDALNPFYNICRVAGSSLGVKRTAEYKKKLSKSRTGFVASDEFKRKCSERMKGNKYTLGKKLPQEVIDKIRAKTTGSKRNEETKKKMGAWQIGKTKSEETKKKISNGHITYNYVIKHLSSEQIHETNNLRTFTIQYHLHEGHLNDTFKGYNNNGIRIKQHKGYVLISKNLINKNG